ncbi:MAG: hypothetical protein OEZ43_08660 [Gammaproteobacteria bacterium]|nr:hypothetical protein [Gammaproteobacteria bacterium]
MKKHLVLAICIALLPGLVSASGSSAPTPENRASDALGVSVGWITGKGMMYRRYMGDNYFQAGMIAYYNKDQGDKYGDLALMVGRYIHYTNFSEQFFPVALKVLMGAEVEIGAEYEDPLTYLQEKSDYFHIGAGIGMDIGNPAQRGFALSLDLTYIASFRDLQLNEKGLVFVEPRPGVSFFYNF